MLEELTAYKTFGTASHVSEIARAIDGARCTLGDLFIIADSNHTVEIPRIEAAVALLSELGLCAFEDGRVQGLPDLRVLLDGDEPAGVAIARLLLSRMLAEKVLPVAMIKYDLKTGRGYLTQHDIPIRYSQMRNYLIDAGILIFSGSRIYLEDSEREVQQSVAPVMEGGMTPEELLKRLEEDKAAGAAAEAFVMEYERARIGSELAASIRQVSLISVSAGYDIASFDSPQSDTYDRFIEVKAVGSNGFHFSANELAVARKLGRRYCLYLVDLRKKHHVGYEPEIIFNPAERFSNADDWRITPDSYHVTRIVL